MNAIAEREYIAHELAERRRAYIAEQIRNCLYGKTLYVDIAWHEQAVIQRESRLGLVECMEHALIKAETGGFAYSAKLLVALDDDGLRPSLRELRDSIIERWARHTHDSMTRQELEALPC